ncbi:sodium-dependent bicarbonate transport family permease [Sinorhizobium meliloti]|uniref:sodium-dependent bicarbonate transport family permease n=1 Tax=Rhizobium meliloti TaxID=382 RepID=UPI003F14B1E1
MDAFFSPMILFFALGSVAALIRSDLAIPETISKAVALYLMAAIGLKGGVQLSDSGYSGDLLAAGLAGVALSLLLPFPAFWLARLLGRLDRMNAGAIAAHYGSVSVVTFVTGVEVLKGVGLAADGFMVAVMALMEAPAILMGIWLARAGTGTTHGSNGHSMVEAFTNGSVVLLTGSFLIGLSVGREGFSPVAPLFEGGFKGMLCLFLLDMGLIATRQFMETRSLTPALVISAVVVALFNGTVGVFVGTLVGLAPGSAAALGILAGSASYIAAPAAVRLALPHVNLGLPLTMALAVTFPFNIIFGIPVIVAMARWLSTLW